VGGCDDELITGDNRGDAAAAHEAVADARRGRRPRWRGSRGYGAIRDARFAETTAAAATSGSPRIQRAKSGEFVADELAVMLRDQPYHVRCLLAGTADSPGACPLSGKPSTAATWMRTRSW
jgi:hypothetical protein